MAKQDLKKYFIFQDGNFIRMVVNAQSEDFDGDTMIDIDGEIKARGFSAAVKDDILHLISCSDPGDVITIGAFDAEEHDETGEIASRIAALDPSHANDLPFEIELFRDNLVATIKVKKGPREISENQVYEFLRGIGIEHGIIDGNVKTLAKKFPYVQQIKIAEGTAPVPGQDAKVELVQSIKTDLKPATRRNGTADFKKLNLISPIREGDIIQIRTPPTQPRAGLDVFGKPIPGREGRDIKLKKGKNTEISDDGCLLIATDEGFLYLGTGNRVNVRDVYIVTGDLDYRYGTVEYKGDIVIKGDIRTGFNVYAGGNVYVHGSVEDSIIEAAGILSIDGGVRASGKAILRAGGDVRVNFIENCRVESLRNIYINREAINCNIRAGGHVEVLWKDGRIVGGDIVAGRWIASPTLGSDMGGPFELALEPPGWDKHFNKLSSIDEKLKFVSMNRQYTQEQKTALQAGLLNQREMAAQNIEGLFERSFISAKAYRSPVNIRFGNFSVKVRSNIGPMTYRYDKMEVTSVESFVDEKVREKLRKL